MKMTPSSASNSKGKVELKEAPWSMRNNICLWGVFLRTVSITLGFVCLSISTYIRSDDSYVKVVKQNEWKEWLSYEDAYIAINSLVTLISLIFLTLVIFSNNLVIRSTLSFWQHGLGTIALLISLVFKVTSAVQMEQILHNFNPNRTSEQENLDYKNNTGSHSAAHRHYVLKGVVAGLTTLQSIIYLHLFIQAIYLEKKIRRAKHAQAFLERQLQFTDNDTEETKSKIEYIPKEQAVHQGSGAVQ